jgi:hypothetical protein
VNVFPSAAASKVSPASKVLGAVTLTVAGVSMMGGAYLLREGCVRLKLECHECELSLETEGENYEIDRKTQTKTRSLQQVVFACGTNLSRNSAICDGQS